MPSGIYKRTKKHKEKIRQTLKGRHISPKTEFKKGISGFSGFHPSEETKEKLRKVQAEEKSVHWKGDNCGYASLHLWVKKYKGKPKICEHCGATYKERRLNWANIDHKYKRKLDNFISLCYSCHRKYDYNLKKEKGEKG